MRRLCTGISQIDKSEIGTATQAMPQNTQRHDANWTMIPPITKPKQRPRVPADAKLSRTGVNCEIMVSIEPKEENKQCEGYSATLRIRVRGGKHGYGGGNGHAGSNALKGTDDDKADDVVHKTGTDPKDADDEKSRDEYRLGMVYV